MIRKLIYLIRSWDGSWFAEACCNIAIELGHDRGSERSNGMSTMFDNGDIRIYWSIIDNGKFPRYWRHVEVSINKGNKQEFIFNATKIAGGWVIDKFISGEWTDEIIKLNKAVGLD